MSIEQNIAALTAAVIELTNAIKAGGATTVPQAAAPVAPVAPVAPQLTIPWNTQVSTPTIRATVSSALVMVSAA